MLKNLINLIYPEVCLGCSQLLLKNEKTICTECLTDLPYTYHHKIVDNDVTRKFYGIIPIEFGAALFYFKSQGISQSLIHHLKYKGKEEIGVLLANLMNDEICSLVKNYVVDEIIPVPLHKKRLKERGYNQVHSFCKTISENLHIPLNEKILHRTIYTDTQTFKDKDSRQYKSSLFEVIYNENAFNKHFLLVDDVITTGATLEKCAKALLTIPGAKVSILTIAYTQS